MSVVRACRRSPLQLRLGACEGCGNWCSQATTWAPAAQVAAKLQRLDLDGCNIGVEGAAALAPALAQCTCLTQLSLGLVCARFAPVAVNALLPALSAMHLLKLLQMFCEQLGEGGYLSIAHALAGRDTLPTLNVMVGLGQSAVFEHWMAGNNCRRCQTLQLSES